MAHVRSSSTRIGRRLVRPHAYRGQPGIGRRPIGWRSDGCWQVITTSRSVSRVSLDRGRTTVTKRSSLPRPRRPTSSLPSPVPIRRSGRDGSPIRPVGSNQAVPCRWRASRTGRRSAAASRGVPPPGRKAGGAAWVCEGAATAWTPGRSLVASRRPDRAPLRPSPPERPPSPVPESWSRPLSVPARCLAEFPRRSAGSSVENNGPTAEKAWLATAGPSSGRACPSRMSGQITADIPAGTPYRRSRACERRPAGHKGGTPEWSGRKGLDS